MPRKKFDPGNPEVTKAIVDSIKSMSPKELYEFLTYRKPGIPETNMTGLFPVVPIPTWKELQEQRRIDLKPACEPREDAPVVLSDRRPTT